MQILWKTFNISILFFASLTCFSQTPKAEVRDASTYRADSAVSPNSKNGYIPSLAHNIVQQAVAPFHFTKNEWFATAAIAVSTAALINFDSEIDEWAGPKRSQSSIINYVSPKITQLGSNAGIYGIVGFGALSAIFKYNKGIQTSLRATQALITSGIWVHAIKLLSLRERPDQSYISQHEGGKWYGPGNLFDNDISNYRSVSNLNAFVSGHTASIFSIATVVATEYKDTPVVPALAYTTAVLSGLSRMTEHKHWASDVFLGAILGYVCGKQVSNHFNANERIPTTAQEPKANLSVFERNGQIGLRLSWKK